VNNDITFCLNEDCPVKHKCRRGQEPTKSMVSTEWFEYLPIEDEDEVICSGWWRLKDD
jgi:hypothetical protein